MIKFLVFNTTRTPSLNSVKNSLTSGDASFVIVGFNKFFNVRCIHTSNKRDYSSFSSGSFPCLKERKKIFYSVQIREFNTSHINLNSRDPLYIPNGSYTYLKDVKMPYNLEWKDGKVGGDKIGDIGWFSGDKPLSSFGNFKQNVCKLNTIFNSFSPFNSYSLIVMVYQSNMVVKTVQYHYLVNNTTNGEELMKDVYNWISDHTTKYNFKIGDKIICRYKPLYLKVKDPKFIGGRINNTVFKPTTTKLNVYNRMLSSKFLPHTMNLSFYGILFRKEENVLFFDYNNYIVKLEIIELNRHHRIQILDIITLKLVGEVEDLSYGDTFIREFINEKSESTYIQYDLNFKLLNIEYKPKISFLSRASKEFKHKNNFLTFDIETYKDSENHFVPYACGFYDGKRKYLYYLTDFSNHNEMICKCLKDMMVPRYHNYTIYTHNSAKFDTNFIYIILEKEFKVKNVLPKDSGIMSFVVNHKVDKKNVKLTFYDSICLLPSSLAELGESFKVETVKDIFPYNFVNHSNLNYVGALPDFKYYNQEDGMIFRYQLMVNWYNNNWSMREETLKYLSKDIVSLHQVLVEMDKITFSNYRINITSHPTIASLSFKILRSNFLKDDKLLPKSKGEIEYCIRNAYYGGRTEVFKPFGYFLYAYDYNSLYPSAMLKDMPVGEPTFSLIKDLSKIFGFVKVKVTSPDNIYVPLLPCRVKTRFGDYKLIFPVGTWSGWYFSEEVKLAELYGYKIEVIESYLYERGKDVFKEFVEHMASIKDSSTGAMKKIHKLFLNTPYGRMGMNNNRDVVKKVSKKEFEYLELRYNIVTCFELDNDKVFVKHSKYPDPVKCEQSGVDFYSEMLTIIDCDMVDNSPAVASAVASWARIIMYPWLSKAYYSDTDSVFLKNPLNSSMVGKGLGKFKQEYGGIIKKAIFPSPKLYILDTIEGYVNKSKGYSGKLLMLDYINLYQGGFVQVKDWRWRRHLELENVTLTEQDYCIGAEFDKRNKLYSLGRWVDTSPIFVNEDCEVVSMDIIVYGKQTDIICYCQNYD